MDATNNTNDSNSSDKLVSKAERTFDPQLKRYDLPKDEAIKQLAVIQTASQGRSKVFFKYTCPQCKTRCMFGTPNTLYDVGICPTCGHEHEITEAGFMVVTDFVKPPAPQPETLTSDTIDDIRTDD